MINVDEEYTQEKTCEYKGESYNVRDNGAIYRFARKDKPKRAKDEIWTFGEKIDKGYAKFCGESVHRIVAFAFHGNPPTNQHVVDHIDTNRQNNRPENLRWLTKLENVLLNPFTRKKIEYLCGSVENFLKNPSLLKGHEADDSNFIWMGHTSLEEGRQVLAHWEHLSNRPKTLYAENRIANWIYSRNNIPSHNNTQLYDIVHGNDGQKQSAEVVAEEELPETAIDKKEFLTAVMEICDNKGWHYEKYYKDRGLETDLLITANEYTFAISVSRKAYELNSKCSKYMSSNIKEFYFLLSPKHDSKNCESYFSVHRYKDSISIKIQDKKIRLTECLEKLSKNKISCHDTALITALKVMFVSPMCESCGSFIPYYYVRYLIDNNERIYDRNDLEQANVELPDLGFGEEVLSAINQYIKENPKKKVHIEEVESPYNKENKELAFVCPHCNSIFRGRSLSNFNMEIEYEEDETQMTKVKLIKPFAICSFHWVVE